MQLDSVLPPSFICTEQIRVQPERERERERERKTKREVSDREAEIERISLRGDDKTEGGGGEGEAARCSIKELQRPPRAQTEQAAGGI